MLPGDQYKLNTNVITNAGFGSAEITEPENAFAIKESLLEEDVYPVGRRTNHILIIDGNGLLRSKLARFVLLTAKQYGRSCAIYHLSHRQTQAELTYFQSADSSATNGQALNQPELDFAIYEAASSEIVTDWLQEGANTSTNSMLDSFGSGLQRSRQLRLTVVAEAAIRPAIRRYEELNLINFLEKLAVMTLPVNLMFASFSEQDQKLVQELLRDEQPYLFLDKKSERWSKLPIMLVKQSDFFTFQPLKVGITTPVAKKYKDIPAA